MIKGWKKLTKSEIRHLCENKCYNTVAFQSTIDSQAEHERQFLSKYPLNAPVSVCFECKQIAHKLGMEPKGGWPE